MIPKRPFYDDGEDSTQESKRFRNAVKGALGRLSVTDFPARMEPFLRRVVREEVEKAVQRLLQPSSRPSFNQAGSCGARGFLLQFVNQLPSTIFTGSRIEAEDGDPIRIELLDANTKNIVKYDRLSAMKIEIVVLHGDFGSDDQEDWSENEFSSSVIRAREGRRPLVTGELTVILQEGVGHVGDVSFTDNSSWQRSRRFRLGARPVQKVSAEVRIREARSEAFMVKDHRGALYQKHHPPSLGDEIWRLEKIAKDGAFHGRLASGGIRTVKDFLQLYALNPSALRNMLGGGISNRIWDTIVEHATKCVTDDNKFYTYYEAGQGIGLLFDSIYKLVAASFDGQRYESLDNLSPRQKGLVEKLKLQASKNLQNFVDFDGHAILGPSRPLTSLQAEPFHGRNVGPQQLEYPMAHQDQPEMQLAFDNSSSSTSYAYGAESSSHLEVSLAQNSHPMQVCPPMLRNSFKFEDFFQIPYTGENSWPQSGSQWPVMTSGQVTAEGIPQIQTSTWPTINPTWGQGNALFIASGNDDEEVGIISSLPSLGVHRIRKPNTGWCKLRAAFKWESVRRDVAARRLYHGLCM